jgi:hypothetical protein
MTPGQIAFLIFVVLIVALITAAFFVDADDF